MTDDLAARVGAELGVDGTDVLDDGVLEMQILERGTFLRDDVGPNPGWIVLLWSKDGGSDVGRGNTLIQAAAKALGIEEG